jgi:hypothetical protein
LLRTGAANFSAPASSARTMILSSLKNPEVAIAFKRAFDARFSGGEALLLGVK